MYGSSFGRGFGRNSHHCFKDGLARYSRRTLFEARIKIDQLDVDIQICQGLLRASRSRRCHRLLELSYVVTNMCSHRLQAHLLLRAALHNLLSPILAAIFAGNGIVVKCSENVVWSSQWFIGAVKECLRACGQDPELVQVRDT
jgi:hypothetical protein